MSDSHFRLMSFIFRLRDLFNPPQRKLHEAGIKPGHTVLDFGCGPGTYAAEAAALTGTSGTVYAVDISTAATAAVQRLALRRHLPNLHAICSECTTGLPDAIVDVVLLYDILHDLKKPGPILRELNRVLKPGGILSVSDHHMDRDQIRAVIGRDRLFKLLGEGKKTFTFVRAETPVGGEPRRKRRRRRKKRSSVAGSAKSREQDAGKRRSDRAQ